MLWQCRCLQSAEDAAAQLQSAAGLRLSQALGAHPPQACQGLQDGEALTAAAWEESLLAGSRGSAKKGPGIMPRALAITSYGDIVRLAMLPGPQGMSRCQVIVLSFMRGSSAIGPKALVPQLALLHVIGQLLLGQWLSCQCRACLRHICKSQTHQ